MNQNIVIQKAEENNLKKIDVEIPRNGLTVITGVSGSGKSSLAFDTVFQEGQRKYIESLSAYARQFIGSVQAPRAEKIYGISPTISIDQKTTNRNSRSTVGTVTEILDHLRLLYARLGEARCPVCDSEIQSQTPSQIATHIINEHKGQKLIVLAPVVQDRKGEYRKDLENFLSMGFVRARIDGEIRSLEDKIKLARYEKHTIELVVDRLKVNSDSLSRLEEAIETALKYTDQQVAFLANDQYFSRGTNLSCPNGHGSIPELEPRLFSFNDKNGQCSLCKGLGLEHQLDIDKVITDPNLSLLDKAIGPMTAEGFIIFTEYGLQEQKILAKEYGIDLKKPWKNLTKKEKHYLAYGSDGEIKFTLKKRWSGRGRRVTESRRMRGFMEVLERLWDRYNPHIMHKYMNIHRCPSCDGARLNPFALAVRFDKENIHDLTIKTIDDLVSIFKKYPKSKKEAHIGGELFKEIQSRLNYLQDVGLGYLSLDRSSATLSGGESQRIRLASQVGSDLQGVTYVLDEPSIGLHPRDNDKLLEILLRLRDQGNTLVVVEHDEDTMRLADTIIDIGPGAGKKGGELLAQGPINKILKNKKSLTGAYLSGKAHIAVPERRKGNGEFLEVIGAQANNLKNIDVPFKVGAFNVITGVSGSGKSTLVYDILYKALANKFHRAEEPPGEHKEIKGLDNFEKVIDIDQSPIGRTPRSNPVTYTKVFDEIRNLFAGLTESKIRGYSKGRFSFNVKGGRCEDCKGAGYKEVEMQLLANVQVVCDTCNGRRFNPATLEIHYKGKSIDDVLNMTIAEALEFFDAHAKIKNGLSILNRIGLGYLNLGQPSTTLSGGEAQRMKIASELRKPAKGSTLYLLDEPTTGLHFADIEILINCMQELVDKGHTLIVVEHNLDVIKVSDYVVDLGPEAGSGGGELVVKGTPEQILKSKKSLTAKYLKPLLNEGDSAIVSKYADVKKKKPKAVDRDIKILGAKKHNLKNIDVNLPFGKLIGVAGVSGAGKSSLAFHTLFAEGQRRFVESLSTYARRFLGAMDRGAVESIEGLAPAIAIDQSSSNRSPRSTVATITELHDYFRLMYARLGQIHCPRTNSELKQYSYNDVLNNIFENHAGEAICIYAPLYLQNSTIELSLKQWSSLPSLADKFQSLGYRRFWISNGVKGSFMDLPYEGKPPKGKELYLYLDRVKVNEENRERIMEALENAAEAGHGIMGVGVGDKTQQKISLFSLYPGHGPSRYFLHEEIDPKFFSFNSHWGACETCGGLGVLGRSECDDCNGEKLKLPWRDVTLGEKRLGQIIKMDVNNSNDFFESLKFDKNEKLIAKAPLDEIRGRLEFLNKVGLGYLCLDRTGDTLSGGEAQRIRLASQIGSGLMGVLYVLDEPTIGLHQKDTEMLLKTLKDLRDLGNTVVVVEHDLEFLNQVDQVLELGPHAGELGGEVMFQGSVPQIKKSKSSPTGFYLNQGVDRLTHIDHDEIKGTIIGKKIKFRNLEIPEIQFDMGRINSISGVSGSGKSTLVLELMFPELKKYCDGKTLRKKDTGHWSIDYKDTMQTILIDQGSIGAHARSTPATYGKLFDKVRDLYASLKQSKMMGYNRGRFSFNKAEGRCPACEGRGSHHVEMHFLSNLWETCEVCKGNRYNNATLEVKYKGKSIADVLNMTFQEAVDFFSDQMALQSIVQCFCDLGLGYLRLGQPGNTLSGGESQRLKIATQLGSKTRGHTVYVLDEPTTGLHSQDIERLWKVLNELVAKNNTVILIEHQPDILRQSDRLVDLGPGGGPLGGKLLYQGAPEGLKKIKKNATGQSLFVNAT
jgi:excinuclease ABC subunit A